MKNVQNKKKQISYFKDGSLIHDLVGDKAHQSFVQYDPISEKIELLDSYQLGDIELVPPTNNLVESGTIVLPTYPEEFGDVSYIFEQVKNFINKYVDIPQEFLIISSLYVILTWVFDCFDVVPYLRVVGEFGTGKSRFLLTVGSLCYKPCFAGGATSTSPIFRINEIYGGVTLVFDEADFKYSGADSDMIKILNTGYMKGMPVLRTEGDGNNRNPKGFNVFGPKIIATRGQFQDAALESRCLTQVMAGKPRKDIPRHLPKNFQEEAGEIRNRLLMFRLKNHSEVEVDHSLEVDGLDPRVNQVALPILSIIHDEKVKQEVIIALRGMQASLNDLKQTQEPALIINAIFELAKSGELAFTYKKVAEKINEFSGIESDSYHEVSPSKIGRINKSVLNLEVHQVSGVYRFRFSKQNLKKVNDLAKRYSLEVVDEVDLVELCFGSSNDHQDEGLIKNVAETLF